VIFLWVLFVASSALYGQGASKIGGTKHNLSASGPGPLKVAGEHDVCKFCHTPHAASPIAPLWNRKDPGSYYQTYESSTMVAQPGQPSGSSRLCLSCHDGTIALQETYNSRNAISGSLYISPEDSGYIGTDLTDDHPISFTYDSSLAVQNGALHDPLTLPSQLPLGEDMQLQCTTCHDAHDDTYGDFLRMSNQESAMCVSCHDIANWPQSSHATSTALLASATRDTWDNLHAATVRESGCESCHRPHSAGGHERLLRHATEEDNCFPCHDGTVASTNILAETLKISSHRVADFTGVHDPTENPLTMPEHVECSDCHNPHQATGTPSATAPFIKPSMKGVSGVASSGTEITQAVYEYEVCFKCHAWNNFTQTPVVYRVIQNSNMAERFSPSNPSYHPVEALGKNADVPSLLQPLNASSMIYCTDCHGSDSGQGGAAGPHGSNYSPLLVRNYETQDGTSESPSAYALCYGCHSRASILADTSFEKHHTHITDENAPCSVCHDPHGISATQGTATGNSQLINFDRDVVKPSPSAGGIGPMFEDRGYRRGSCTLLCHGEDHNDRDYAP